jgi:hypothetical protein
MSARSLALIFGIAYLGAGLLGLMPGMLLPSPAGAPALHFDVMNGRLLGLFPVNMLLTLLYLLAGAWGLGAYMGWWRPRIYARSLALLFGALGVLGLIPGLNTLYGWLPLYGHDVWLHLGTAAVAAYLGFRKETGERRTMSGDRRKASRAPLSNERRQGMYDRRRSQYLPQG